MLTSQPTPDPFFLVNLFFEKPPYKYNSMLFTGVLFARPMAMGLVMMMPFFPALDLRTPLSTKTLA